MSDKTASTRMADIPTSSFHNNDTEFSQSSLEVQVTEATCLKRKLSEVSTANRSKAANNLRAIAHLLMSGALGMSIAFSCEFIPQTSRSDLTVPEQGRSERVL